MNRTVLLYVIFFLSGIAGLGYEIVWTRMFAVGLGHEMPSVLAVLAAFFGGLALGAWALDRVVSTSRRPGHFYAGLEVVIGVWALASIALIPALNRLAAVLMGIDPSPLRHWLVAFAVPFFALLPATAAMGATLPAMERLCARLRGSGRTVGGLYAVNTAGAVTGTLTATFAVIPAFGYGRTLLVFAAVNVACAAGTVLGPARGEQQRAPVLADMQGRPSNVVIGLLVAMTGLLGIGYEVLCVRVMGQVLENTVYSFASALSVYLVGTAAGAAVYQRLGRRAAFPKPAAWLLQGLAVTCLLGGVVLNWSSPIYEWTRLRLGATATGAVAAEMILALLVFGLPTVLMGATFSHLAQAARGSRGGVGRALGLNTLGAALAPLLFGVVLLPMVGAKWALSIAALGYLMLLLPVPGLPSRHMIPSLAVIPVFALLPARLALVETPGQLRIIEYREGVMATVAVLEDPRKDRVLKVNNRFQMGGTKQSFADRRQALIPLLLHPEPRSVLFLGLGTGITAGAATSHPGVSITGVELLPEVIEVLPSFAPANQLDRVRDGSYLVADARRYVRAADNRFDVIVADLFHPARDGAGALYTREHFEAVRARLNEHGLFCQWLPLYQLDLDTLALIVRTFLGVYSDATAWIAHFNIDTPMLGLIGGAGGAPYVADFFERRVTDTRLIAATYEVALNNSLTLFGCLLADTDDLRRFAGEGPLNTDDRPLVVFDAPRLTYRKDEPRYGRLQSILDACSPGASEIIHAAGDPVMAERLDRYLSARDLFLGAMILLEQDRDEEAVLQLVQSVRTSRDFRAGYQSALQLAVDRRESDPDRSRYLLTSLIEANPEDSRARRALGELFPE